MNKEIHKLFRAVANMDIKRTEKLLKSGININAKKSGQTLLHVAVDNDDLEMITLILHNGGDINQCDKYGDTPLEAACLQENEEVVKLLLENHCDLDNTACHYASSIGTATILKMLIASGADVNKKDFTERTPLHWAAQEDHMQIVQLLVENGAEISVLDDEDQSPLYIASAENHYDIMKYLLEKGAKTKNVGEVPPFMIACYYRNYEIMNLMMESGVDVDVRDEEGHTALFDAMVQKDEKLIEYLVDKNADRKIQDSLGISIEDLKDENLRMKLYKERY